MGVVGLVGLFMIEIVAQYRDNVKTRVSVEGGVMRRDGGWRFPTRGGVWVKKFFRHRLTTMRQYSTIRLTPGNSLDRLTD